MDAFLDLVTLCEDCVPQFPEPSADAYVSCTPEIPVDGERHDQGMAYTCIIS
uniref:Putative pheromone n=1 Tax=Flammulina velutipes TaxID=38945 RepID=M4MCL5_FLAVE